MPSAPIEPVPTTSNNHSSVNNVEIRPTIVQNNTGTQPVMQQVKPNVKKRISFKKTEKSNSMPEKSETATKKRKIWIWTTNFILYITNIKMDYYRKLSTLILFWRDMTLQHPTIKKTKNSLWEENKIRITNGASSSHAYHNNQFKKKKNY